MGWRKRPKKQPRKRSKRTGRRRERTLRKVKRRASPSSQERRLLQLAREVTVLARAGRAPREVLGEALARLAAPAAGRAQLDEAGRLALAWAREQARLAVAEVLELAVKAGVARTDVPPSTLSWLALAATQSLTQEMPEAAQDRLQALADFIRPAGRPW